MTRRETPQEARRRIFGESERTGRPPAANVRPGRPAPSPPEPRDRLKALRSLDRLRRRPRLRDRILPPAPTPQQEEATASAAPSHDEPATPAPPSEVEVVASPAQPASDEPAAPAPEEEPVSSSASQEEAAAPAAPSHDEPVAPAPPPPPHAATPSPAPSEGPVASSAPKEVDAAGAPAPPALDEPAASAPEDEEPVSSFTPAREEPAAPAFGAHEEETADPAFEQQVTADSPSRSFTQRQVAGEGLTKQPSEQSSTLARHEKRLARLERREAGTTAGIGVSPALVAGIVAFLAAEALVAAVVLALDSDLKTWAAAAIVGMGLMIIAAVVALMAKRRVD